MRLVAYVRVSLEEEAPENQEYAIYQWASVRGHQIVSLLKDLGVSGGVNPLEREGFREALERLKDPNVDGLVVYSLDRVARSLWDLYRAIRHIEDMGKVVISVKEEWLNTLDPKLRGLIIAILGWAGEMEREMIRSRTKEALARLKAQGKKLGRPSKWNSEVRDKVLNYIQKGYSLKDIAKIVGIGYSTLKRYVSKDLELSKAFYEMKMKKRFKTALG